MAAQNVNRALHRITRDRNAAGQCFDHHQPESICAARKNEAIGAAIGRSELFASQSAEEMDMGVLDPQRSKRRAISDHHLGAGEIEIEEVFKVLFRRNPADIEQDRARQINDCRVEFAVRAEQPVIDPPGPAPNLRNAARNQFVTEADGGRQHSLTIAVESAEDWPEPFRTDPGADRSIVGKAGVKCGGEGDVVGLAPAAYAPADRTFGGDVNHIRTIGAEQLARRKARCDGQVDRTVAGHRDGPEPVRGDQLDLIAAPIKFGHCGTERADHAVDLRVPGVTGNCDAHQASSSSG